LAAAEAIRNTGCRDSSRCFFARVFSGLVLLDRRIAVPRSLLDAIKVGEWNFEPQSVSGKDVSATTAMPGTSEKLDVMAERLRQGLPLWHPRDRMTYDDSEEA
jgi:hypothetical protein